MINSPEDGVNNPIKISTIVLLPLPVVPIIPIELPFFISKLTFSKIQGVLSSYLNDIFLKYMVLLKSKGSIILESM